MGCGNWGKNHARVFHQLGALKAVCDIDSSKAMGFSEKYAIPVRSFEDILNDSTIDAIVITTPSHTHEPLIHQALSAHKHVFVEKPFTLSTKTASSLTQYAQDQKRILMVGHLLQYHGMFNQVKKLKKNGALGKLHYVSSHRFSCGKFPGEKSVLWDFAPHDVSMILSLIGKMPYRIQASYGNYLQHTDLDRVCIHLDFEANIQAQIVVSWLHPCKEQKLTVIGEQGMLVFDDCQSWENKLKLYRHPAAWQDGLPHPFVNQPEAIIPDISEPLTNECQHFLNCINSHSQPLTDGHEGTQVVRVLEAVMEAIHTQHPVELAAQGSFKSALEVV